MRKSLCNGLLCDAVGILGRVTSECKIIKMNWKGCGRK